MSRPRPSPHRSPTPVNHSGFRSTSLLLLYLTLALFARSQSGDQRVTAMIREGQSALDAGDFSRAVQEFENARQLAPENAEINRGLVLGYLQAGRLADAQKVAEFAVSRWPRDARLQHWLGLVYFKEGQHQNALQALQRSESLSPSSSDIHFDIALVYLSKNQYPSAADELEKAIKRDPSSALPH